MKIHQTMGAAALLGLVGCGSEAVPTEGSYKLDCSRFAPTFADRLIELGEAPADARTAILAQLRSSKFDLQLREDGTFSATQRILVDEREYRGTWKLTGTALRLDQTHENGSAAPDYMTGTLVDGKLDLRHKSVRGTMDLRLVRESPPAAPPR